MSNAVDAKTNSYEEETIPVLELRAVSKNGTIPCRVSGSLKIPMADGADLELCFPSAGDGSPVNIVDYKTIPGPPKWQVLVGLSNDCLPTATVVRGNIYGKYICVNALLCFEYPDRYTINEYTVQDDKELRKRINDDLMASQIGAERTQRIQDYAKSNYIRRCCLLSEDINPGEWLLPIRVKRKREETGTNQASGKQQQEGEQTGPNKAGGKSESRGGETGANPTNCVVVAYVRVRIVDETDASPAGVRPEMSKSASDAQDTSKTV